MCEPHVIVEHYAFSNLTRYAEGQKFISFGDFASEHYPQIRQNPDFVDFASDRFAQWHKNKIDAQRKPQPEDFIVFGQGIFDSIKQLQAKLSNTFTKSLSAFERREAIRILKTMHDEKKTKTITIEQADLVKKYANELCNESRDGLKLVLYDKANVNTLITSPFSDESKLLLEGDRKKEGVGKKLGYITILNMYEDKHRVFKSWVISDLKELKEIAEFMCQINKSSLEILKLSHLSKAEKPSRDPQIVVTNPINIETSISKSEMPKRQTIITPMSSPEITNKVESSLSSVKRIRDPNDNNDDNKEFPTTIGKQSILRLYSVRARELMNVDENITKKMTAAYNKIKKTINVLLPGEDPIVISELLKDMSNTQTVIDMLKT